jgi:DnaJ-class molecular chaperone
MKQITKNPYEVLGVDADATEDDIKTAYKKLALKHHPDRGGKSEKMAEINWAYEVLSDPDKRAHYDRFGYDVEDHSNITPMEQDLLKIWSDLISSAGFEPKHDFFVSMRKAINSRIQGTQEEISQMEARLPKFRKLRDKVHKKAKGKGKKPEDRTIFHIHLDKTIAAAEDHIKECKGKLELYAEQLQYLEGFELEAEAVLAPQSWPTFEYSSSLFGPGPTSRRRPGF